MDERQVHVANIKAVVETGNVPLTTRLKHDLTQSRNQ